MNHSGLSEIDMNRTLGMIMMLIPVMIPGVMVILVMLFAPPLMMTMKPWPLMCFCRKWQKHDSS